MKTFLDIVRELEYRASVEQRLASIAENPNYHFPRIFPRLYRYRPLSYYAVDDIINGQETATSIGDFNDLFDGAIHRYGSAEEQLEAAERRWSEIDSRMQAIYLPEGILKHDDYVAMYQQHYKGESRSGFDLLNYIGTYVCCFSEKQTATLMWAHYADSNKGICIAYDFNQWDTEALHRYLLFPVAYSKQPIKLVELMEDKESKLCQYPTDTAVLCAALNKASIWQYEYEWRIVLVLAGSRHNSRRVPLLTQLKPVSICFGYHFLKPFFCYDHKNRAEYENCRKSIENFKRLVEYMIKEKIPAEIMWPNIGSYNMTPKKIAPAKLLQLIKHYFSDNHPKNIRFYRTIHDDLYDYIEKDCDA